MKFDGFTKNMITNCVSVVAGSFAIATACKVTKSALPLFAFALIPRWSYSETNESNKEGDK